MPGHKEKFQSPLKREDITCPKCSYVLKVPIKARCGHTFCKDCVTDLCPLDGEEIIIQQEELIQLRDKISNLVVTCYEPCFWIGLLKESKDHFKECAYYHQKKEKIRKICDAVCTELLPFMEELRLVQNAIMCTLKTFNGLAYMKKCVSNKTSIGEIMNYFIEEVLIQDNSKAVLIFIEYLKEENSNCLVYDNFLSKVKEFEASENEPPGTEASTMMQSTEESEEGRCSSPLHLCLLPGSQNEMCVFDKPILKYFAKTMEN